MQKITCILFFIVLGGVFLTLLFVVSGKKVFVLADSCDLASAEYADCISNTKDEISTIEKKLKKETKDLNSLQQNLNQINTTLTSTQQIIRKTQILLNEAAQTIKQKEQEVANLEQQLILEKEVLKGLIRELYSASDIPFPEIILTGEDVLGLFQENDNLLSTQEKMQSVIQDINDIRGKVIDEKGSLEDVKKDQEQLLVLKNKQKQNLVTDQIDTAGNIEDQQATISELKSKLNELNGDLNKLLGKSYDAKNIKDAIKFAAGRTGIREGFLFGMLSVESRLGASVGGCDYKQSRMSAYRLGIFKSIASELSYDYKKLKVSCPPASYKGTGGAMGAAQFMSDTWSGYKKIIASNTGHNPPDPWNLTDGVTAMASKLANDGGTKSGKTTITSPCNGKKISVKWETYASMRYLGWSCYALNNYSVTIQNLSGNYKDL